jgi:homocysteine S-methyltransferase
MTEAPLCDEGRIRILDGGTGSELRRRGVGLSDRCWSAPANLSHPELLTDIHLDYIRAGADIVTANTFATSRFVLAGAGLETKFEKINRAAIAAARRAADAAEREIVVAASLSCLPPSFDPGAFPPPGAEYEAYAELAACFRDNGADLILVEMMQDTIHAPRACRAARDSGLPFWIGVSCRFDRARERLVAFDDPDQPLDAILDAVLPFEPAGVAVMHSPLSAVAPALTALAARWAGPSGAYAEIPHAEDAAAAGGFEPVGPPGYAAAARDWLDRGVILVGGCCGTTPAHVAALRALLALR